MLLLCCCVACKGKPVHPERPKLPNMLLEIGLPKIVGTFLVGPYNKDKRILGLCSVPPNFRKLNVV